MLDGMAALENYKNSLLGMCRTGGLASLSATTCYTAFFLVVENLEDFTSPIARAVVLVASLAHAVGLGARRASLVVESEGVSCT